jgi:heme exporter protein D
MQSPETFAQNLLTPKLPRSFFDTIRGLRGEASATGFRVEMAGGQSQMVYAAGRLEVDRAGTSVQVLLTFKRWPLIVLAGSALLIPLAWAVMGFFGFQMPWIAVVLVLLVGVVGNFLFGLDQRRRLLAQIKRATDAQEVSPS